jgi:membrane protease YdiL (CAAX protease family)
MTARWHALAHVALFLLGSAAWVAVLGVTAAVVAIALGLDPERPEDLGGAALGVLSVAQTLGMTGLALALGSRLPSGDGAPGWRGVFPLGARGGWWAVGLLAGLTVWTFPSWLAEQLGTFVQTETLTVIARGLTSGGPAERLTLAFAVAVAAPVLEELVFRGYVWRALEAHVGGLAALVGSTLLFCAYHLDPVQSVALLPTAAVLGWLRLRSGSVLPSIVAHFVNNALGVALAGVETSLPGWAAVGGAVATLAILGVAERAGVVSSAAPATTPPR